MGRSSRRRARARADQPKPWTPLKEATIVGKQAGLYDPAVHGYVFKNSQYTAYRRMILDDAGELAMIHLSVKRNDKEPIRDWRDMQRIKNELCGPEWEGVELYPAESRLVDTANQFHLWCFPFRLQFGFHEGRLVDNVAVGAMGGKQRPHDEGVAMTGGIDGLLKAKLEARSRAVASGAEPPDPDSDGERGYEQEPQVLTKPHSPCPFVGCDDVSDCDGRCTDDYGRPSRARFHADGPVDGTNFEIAAMVNAVAQFEDDGGMCLPDPPALIHPESDLPFRNQSRAEVEEATRRYARRNER